MQNLRGVILVSDGKIGLYSTGNIWKIPVLEVRKGENVLDLIGNLTKNSIPVNLLEGSRVGHYGFYTLEDPLKHGRKSYRLSAELIQLPELPKRPTIVNGHIHPMIFFGKDSINAVCTGRLEKEIIEHLISDKYLKTHPSVSPADLSS